MKKNSIHSLLFGLSILAPSTSFSQDVFQSAIRPITSPTLFELAVPRTQVHAIYMRQNHPNLLNTTAGLVPVGGNFNLYALQFEIALNERTSIIANKDGYIDFNPNATLSRQEGFANLGFGIKRALIYRPETAYILSGIATVEIPTGDSEVWQGEGDGALNLHLSGLKLYDKLQLAGSAGLHIPFDSAESFTGSLSLHASYEVTSWFIPIIELNWHRVFSAGDGSFTFDNQGGNLVPTIAQFEGGDLINLGALNADNNRDAVTLGLGFRSRLNDQATIGFAYEFPLTNQKDGLLDDRFTVDFVWTF